MMIGGVQNTDTNQMVKNTMALSIKVWKHFCNGELSMGYANNGICCYSTKRLFTNEEISGRQIDFVHISRVTN